MSAPGQDYPDLAEIARGRVARFFNLALGALCVVLGFLILALDETPRWPLALLALPCLTLGSNALWAGWRGRASWLARIGPLP
ncbi:hypothetical protein [Azonexus sp.]|uniref:hypothetical protein n=1 Tax=Azonexus sp. TaxID=1872668 RepID=UPI0039E5F522